MVIALEVPNRSFSPKPRKSRVDGGTAHRGDAGVNLLEATYEALHDAPLIRDLSVARTTGNDDAPDNCGDELRAALVDGDVFRVFELVEPDVKTCVAEAVLDGEDFETQVSEAEFAVYRVARLYAEHPDLWERPRELVRRCVTRNIQKQRVVNTRKREYRRRMSLRNFEQSLHIESRPVCVTPRRGRAARVSTNGRTQGSRRSRTGSSSSSSDPGDSSGDSDPDGSRSRSAGESFSRGHRFCLGCGEPLVGRRPQTLYCGDACKQTYYRNGRVAAKPVSRGWQTAVQRVNLAASMWPEHDRARFIRLVIERVIKEQRRLLASSPGNKHWIDFYDLMLHGKGPAKAFQPGLWALLRKARSMSDHGDDFRGSRPARRIKNVRGVLA